MAATLLYDAECAFCTRSARLAERIGVGADVVPWQDYDLASVSLTPEQALAQAQEQVTEALADHEAG